MALKGDVMDITPSCTVLPRLLYYLDLGVCPQRPVVFSSAAGDQDSFCMICIMQNHVAQAFENSGSMIEPTAFVRDLKSKNDFLYSQPPPIAMLDSRE